MISSVDTNILLDILIPGQTFCDGSKRLLDNHISRGRLIICEVVFAELASAFPTGQELEAFLADTGIEIVRSGRNALFFAGARWAEYAKKDAKSRFSCGKCGHSFEIACPNCSEMFTKRLQVMADFLIGAHALLHADCILSRDPGVYKTWFPDLRLIGPQSLSSA